MATDTLNPALLSRADAAALTDVACAHCGLPVPAGLIRAHAGSPAGDQFCCHGCETAHAVIASCNLEAYYRLRDSTQSPEDAAAPVRSTSRRYAEFDDPAFRALYCRPVPGRDDLLSAELYLEGVHCAACLWLVEKLPRVVPGVLESRLDLRRAIVHIVFDPAQVALSRAAKALDTLGYPPHPARDAASRERRKASDRAFLIRMAVAGACAGNVMLLFMALYAGMFNGIEPEFKALFSWVSFALTALALFWPGSIFFKNAWAAVRTRTPHLDVPIALGLGLGGLWGGYNTLIGSGEIYFDSIAALVFSLLVGRFIQQRQQRYAADAVELLFSLTPSAARRVNADGTITDVLVESLTIGDTVDVRPGDCIPVDGPVLSGSSEIDLSMLTGESRPVSCTVGDAAVAGGVNLSAPLRIRVAATGENTRVGRLMRAVENASQRRARIVQLADTMGAWLLYILLALALLTAVIWWHAGPATAIDRAIAVLIVTCPCGLGLATPMAMTVAIGRAARKGILIKGADALESLARARTSGATLFIDKTGTLTTGRQSLVAWHGDDSIRPIVAAIEEHSSHPIALALARDLGGATEPLAITDILQHQGRGITALCNHRRITIGSARFVRTTIADLPPSVAPASESPLFDADAAERSALEAGHTPVLIAVDDRIVAVASIGDPIRAEAPAALARLRTRGWKLVMLSGDHPELVARVGASLGFEPASCIGGVTPEAKLTAVEAARAHGPVIMIGDGVNDAAALAAATVGIAVRGGAEASLAAADISLSREGLAPLAELLDGADSALRTIRLTIAVSLVYNALAAALCITGFINALLAAIIMPSSSLSVVALSLRSGAFKLAPARPSALESADADRLSRAPSSSRSSPVPLPAPTLAGAAR